MPFFLRFNRILLVCFFILAGLGTCVLRAAIVDYNTDELLAKTQVNIATLKTHPISLADVFATIEKQTPFTFVYVATQLPVQAKLALEADDIVPLSRLLGTLTALTDLVFQRRGEKIVVRVRRKDEDVAIMPRDSIAEPCSVPAPTDGPPGNVLTVPRRHAFERKGAFV